MADPTDRSKAVMLTGGGGAGTEAIERLWVGRYVPYFADADPAAILPSIPPERRVAIPRADAPDFVEGLAAACEARGVAALLPGVDEELHLLDALRARLPGVAVVAPPQDFAETMLDKLACAEALAAHGLDAPKTVTGDRAGEMSFPCIAKPRSGRGSRNVMTLANAGQVAPYLALFSASPADTALQELIPGTEYTVYVSADAQGGLRSVIPVKVLQKRGVTIRAEIDWSEPVIRYCEALHAAFRPSGPYNVQLMLTGDQRAVPFEVNPRVSTTFSLAIAAGADPVADYLAADPGAAIPRTGPRFALQRNWLNTITPL